MSLLDLAPEPTLGDLFSNHPVAAALIGVVIVVAVALLLRLVLRHP
jgi:hypothetical protein